jgi:hypothetical protein
MNAGISPGIDGEAKQNTLPKLKSPMITNQPIPMNFSPARNCEVPIMKKDKTTPTHGR